MSEYDIVIEENDVEGISYFLKNSKANLNDINQTFSMDFKPLASANIYTNGVDTIDMQSRKIEENLNSFRNTILTQMTNFFKLEQELSNEASNIKVPTDFLVVNSYQDKDFKTIILNKDDGLAINKDKNTVRIEDQFNTNIVSENIIDTFNSNSQEVVEINDKYTTSKIDLSLVNNEDVKESKINEMYNIDKITLENINNKFKYIEKTDE